MKRILSIVSVLLTASCLLVAEGEVETSAVLQPNGSQAGRAKHVILLIGDGMGVPQIAAADAYLGAEDGNWMGKLSFEDFPHQGMTTTYASDRLITDSAAAGTAIATGHKTYCGAISVDDNHTPLTSILAEAQQQGKATGVLTTTRVTHATPAVFLAHNVDRDDENAIAIDESLSGVDFLAGGGYRNFVGQGGSLKSKRTDGRDLTKEMSAKGYTTFVGDGKTADFLAYQPKAGDKVLGLFSASHLSYAIDKADQPTLAQMTDKAIQLLSKDDDGFFLMVEGGRIDHACHANDAKTSIIDTLAFNDAVQKAIDYYKQHSGDTLVIIVADHETGGLTLGFAGTEYESAFKALEGQDISYENYTENAFAQYKETHTAANCSLDDLKGDLKNYFGLDNLTAQESVELAAALKRSMDGEVIKSAYTDDYLLYGGYEPFVMEITHVLNSRAGIGWTTYSHTAVPVATYAEGPDSQLVNGMMDNVDIYKVMADALGIRK
ncbi:MAG: alkaline phosphatase [Spirochaetia bacterium]|jgi:alkaline phosphatase|nr:alkaline phosphatase [Spirochaetia bacterium]